MRTLLRIASISLFACSLAPAVSAQTSIRLHGRQALAQAIWHEIANVPDRGTPSIANKARCVIVVPTFKKGASLGSAEYGQGLATWYGAHRDWSAPVFLRMSGGGFGLQAGGEGADMVLVGVSKESGEKPLKEKIKLGGDIGVTPGPVRRNADTLAGMEVKALAVRATPAIAPHAFTITQTTTLTVIANVPGWLNSVPVKIDYIIPGTIPAPGYTRRPRVGSPCTGTDYDYQTTWQAAGGEVSGRIRCTPIKPLTTTFKWQYPRAVIWHGVIGWAWSTISDFSFQPE